MQSYQIRVSRGGGTHLCHASSLAVALKRLLDSGKKQSCGGPSTGEGPRLVQLKRGERLEITVERVL